jgi:hypothetical protein
LGSLSNHFKVDLDHMYMALTKSLKEDFGISYLLDLDVAVELCLE